MVNATQKQILTVKAMADTQPPIKRIEIYRWLASVADDAWIAKQFIQLAADLEAVEKLSQIFDVELSHPRTSKTK